mgnify:FL=1
MTRSRARKFAGALAVSIVLLGVMGALGVARTREANTQQRLISHAYQVKAVLSALRSELDALEIDHVRRALAVDDTGPERQTPSVIKLGNLLRALRDLAADNPS